MSTRLEAARSLVALAEEGCALAAAGELESLEAQQDAWDAAVRALGARGALDAETTVLVERAARLQGEQAAMLATARSEVAAELGRLRRTRQGAQGYAGSGTAGHGSLDASA
jgi:hypothetical protein